MRFGQTVLRMTWKKGFVQFSWKAHCFPVLKRIWGQCKNFENFDAQKYDLGKTSCAWPETSVLYNFHGKRTVFPFWGQFQASLTILRTLTFKNAIWPKRAAHDLKRAFCTIFMKSAPFFLFCENFRPVWLFLKLWRSKRRFGQNVLRMTWKQVLYNFHGKRTVFPFWREFQVRVTILRTLTLKNAIWPKRVFVPWKEQFVQFSWKAHCFPFLERISGPCDDFENFDA